MPVRCIKLRQLGPDWSGQTLDPIIIQSTPTAYFISQQATHTDYFTNALIFFNQGFIKQKASMCIIIFFIVKFMILLLGMHIDS